jgi:ferredoxin
MWRQIGEKSSAVTAGAFGPRTIHRWEHDFTSHCFTYVDQMANQNEGTILHHIKTSYWMPERPDYQSIIAHEAAHAFIYEMWGDLFEGEIDRGDDPFTEFFREAHKLLSDPRHSKVHQWGPRAFPAVREMMADLLALSVMGPSFLYAMFLELLGDGLENIFYKNQYEIDLKIVEDLRGSLGQYDQEQQWYLRLKVACAWLERIHPAEPDSLQDRLVKGVRTIIDKINRFLGSLSRQGADDAFYWRWMAENLEKVVKEISQRKIRNIEKFLEDRSKDYCLWQDDDWTAGARKLPRFTRSLHGKVREFLCRSLIERKRQYIPSDVPDDQRAQKLTEHMKQVYGLNNPNDCDVCGQDCEDSCHFEGLFRHLQDLPWQCSLMRALDFTHPNSAFRPQDQETWFHYMQRHFALGRELYQVALEFHIHQTESTNHHLSEVRRVIAAFIKDWVRHREEGMAAAEGEGVTQDHIDGLVGWLQRNDGESDSDRVQNLLSRAAKTEKEWRKKNIVGPERLKMEDQAAEPYCREFSAAEFIEAHITERNENVKKCIERLERRKLQELFILIDAVPALKKACLPVYNLLAGMYQPDMPGDDNQFYENVIKAIRSDHDRPSRTQPLGTTMLGRITFRAAHRLVKNYGAYRAQMSEDQGGQGTAGHDSSLIMRSMLLGRFDEIRIHDVRPMDRIRLPYFGRRSDGRELFLPFFARWEMALPVWLPIPEGRNAPAEADKQIVALISVVLNRSSARLNLIHRLWRLMNGELDGFQPGVGGPVEYLEHLKDHFQPQLDRIYLSDGWGDLLFVIRGRPGDRLEDAFTIQDCLYQDFQVERTELLLATECFDIAAPQVWRYRTNIQLRLEEDRFLAPGNRDYVKGIQERLEVEVKDDLDGFGLTHSITKTPGRMDLTVNLDPVFIRDGQGKLSYVGPRQVQRVNGLYERLLEAIVIRGVGRPAGDEYNGFRTGVDRIRTNVTKIELLPYDFKSVTEE